MNDWASNDFYESYIYLHQTHHNHKEFVKNIFEADKILTVLGTHKKSLPQREGSKQ